MLKKKVDGLEDYYYQWMNKYKDDADRRLELLIETERRVREHEFAHRRICPYCGCQIGLCYLAIGVDPITKQHDPDCELAKELADA